MPRFKFGDKITSQYLWPKVESENFYFLVAGFINQHSYILRQYRGKDIIMETGDFFSHPIQFIDDYFELKSKIEIPRKSHLLTSIFK